MKIYTKTGDKGQTGLIGGTRVAKNDVRIEAYGTVDELNSFVGLLTTYVVDENLAFLRQLQNQLFTVGSYLATDTSKVGLNPASVLNESAVQAVEREIDRLDEALPPLSAFVIPGGSQSGALCHVCRTVTRRCERRLFDMNQHYSIDNQVFMFFNRLSDYFFVLSRFYTVQSGNEEIYWKK
ncbi:MAG TPA: cob(I)yrinic acid a,c-diamide adenosyltransferase [Paludibacter sp.]|nr:cob(I)yrinic acid a,c-diamide adenosyltransferase [Paludibacter sp.]